MEQAGRVVVTAANDSASAAGIAPEMALADARTLLPALATAPADPDADRALLDRTVSWCGRYTPWTAAEGSDGVWLDVTGCAHLFGGERALLDDLRTRLAGHGLDARAALADSPGAAWAVSHYGGADGQGRTVVPAGGAAAALADLPVAALRLGSATVTGLMRLGLKRIGDLYDMPRAPLIARFGDTVALRLDQALDRIPEPISPHRAPPRYRVRLAFPDPIGLVDDIAAGLRRLLHGLCAQLDRKQRGCRRLELTLYRVDGSLQSAAIGTAGPARDADHLARLFAERLGHLDPGFGVEVMVLSAPVTEPLTPVQIETPVCAKTEDSHKQILAAPKADEPSLAPLRPLLDRLGNRLGFEQVTGLQPCESYLPERTSRIVPNTGGGLDAAWRPAPMRPLRLLVRPEPLETLTPLPKTPETAEEEPPPVFQWRRVTHRLQAAEGPERISPEWWRGDPAWRGGARDYWWAEDRDGRRFWLFREVRLRRDGTSRWFLHGLFA